MRSTGTPTGDWILSDALVLATIRVTGVPESPAGLLDLVAAADAMHHLILSAEMIEHAISRLVAAGLATVDDVGFAATPAGRRLVARARGGPGGDPADRVHSLFLLLQSVPVTPIPWLLDRPTFDAVVLDYRHRLWETFRTGRRRT
jgi:hypothetical protein